ncbi:hypothetical protein [uncultured Senegalimassilia sp.]|uniref:hypothetical protein n=1 Tax=uncultured Senegalimassilia sp. TaxID=1714350 RepID=UPI0025F26968|nr:hypothetical protein [uncultured Senegalimassilia sp.]
MTDRVKPNYSWDWVNGMHIGYTPERIRVEGHGGAVEYVPDTGTCRNVYDEIYDEYEGGRCENGFKCSKCGEIVEDYEGYRITGTFNYCPKCGREVVD